MFYVCAASTNQIVATKRWQSAFNSITYRTPALMFGRWALVLGADLRQWDVMAVNSPSPNSHVLTLYLCTAMWKPALQVR